MPGRGPSNRLAQEPALANVFAAGDAVAEAKLARARAREALAIAEENVWRAIYRHNAAQVALLAVRRGLGAWGAQ